MVIGNSQHGFMKGKSCLIYLIVLYNEVLAWWMRAELCTLSTSTLVSLLTSFPITLMNKLMVTGYIKLTVRWT